RRLPTQRCRLSDAGSAMPAAVRGRSMNATTVDGAAVHRAAVIDRAGRAAKPTPMRRGDGVAAAEPVRLRDHDAPPRDEKVRTADEREVHEERVVPPEGSVPEPKVAVRVTIIARRVTAFVGIGGFHALALEGRALGDRTRAGLDLPDDVERGQLLGLVDVG